MPIVTAGALTLLLESWQDRPRFACIGPSHETKPARPAPAVFQLGIDARRRRRLSIAAMRGATAKSPRFLEFLTVVLTAGIFRETATAPGSRHGSPREGGCWFGLGKRRFARKPWSAE